MLFNAFKRQQRVQNYFVQPTCRSFAPPKGAPVVQASVNLDLPPTEKNELAQMYEDKGDDAFLFGMPDGLLTKPIGAHRNRIIHKLEPRI